MRAYKNISFMPITPHKAASVSSVDIFPDLQGIPTGVFQTVKLH